MPTRDLQKEQAALGKFGEIYGRMPNSSDDWTKLHSLAYTAADMPDEFKTLSSDTSAVGGPSGGVPANTALGADTTKGLPQSTGASGIDTLRANVNKARTGVDDYSQPTYALNILQEAIKEKTKAAGRQIGESEIFKQAGVGGMGALGQSLSARGNEFKINQTVFQNIVGNMAGVYRDTAKAALDKYNTAFDEYKFEANRLQAIENDIRNYEQEIKKADRANQLAKELAYYKTGLESGKGLNFDTSKFDGNVSSIIEGIASVESGGDYDATGADGEIGKYQIMPGNYAAWAKEAGVDPTDKSPEAQDKIANYKITQYWNKYQDPIAVAIAWNGGPYRADQYLKTGEIPNAKGTSSVGGVAYNVEAYAKKFAESLGLGESSTTSAKFTPTEIKKLESAGLTNAPRPDQLDYLYGDDDNKKVIMDAVRDKMTGADGKLDTAKYRNMREFIKKEKPELLAWFDKTWPVKEFLNPNDPTAQDLIYGE